jgi:cell fate (sporulation/competence/biofilm development) regulator YlbF (YheA/YmcA/DUF963 family)
MNVYGQAHQLAKAIQESEEFKQFKAAQDGIKTKPDLDKMIQDFQQKSMEIQLKQMSGEQPDAEDMQKLQQLYGIVAMDPIAASYMESDMRFSIMMKDVYEILGEAMGKGDMFK